MKPLALLVALATVLGHFTQAADTATADNAAPASGHNTTTAPSGTGEETRISVDFSNTEIREILNDVAGHVGYTVAGNETIQWRTSVTQRNTTWIQVFREVLIPVGYDFYPDGKTIRIVGPDDPPAPLVRRSYYCIFGAPADFAEVAKRECAEIGKGRVYIRDGIVEIEADWRHAPDLDRSFLSWDRPRKEFPEKIYLPSELPPRFVPPDRGEAKHGPRDLRGRDSMFPGFSAEHDFEWIDARVAAKFVRTLLIEDGEDLRLGYGPNSLRFAFHVTRWKHAMIEDLCNYLDDRKWYLTPDEQARNETLAAKHARNPLRALAPDEIEACKRQGLPTPSSSEYLSVDFADEEYASILRKVAETFGCTVELPPKLRGRISIKLRNVTCRQIFREILQPIGYGYYFDGRTIHVIDHDAAEQPLVYREHTCVFRPVSEYAERFVRPLLRGEGARLEIDGRTVKFWTTWRMAERFDPVADRVDRPWYQFPALRFWPAIIPPEVLTPPPNTDPDAIENWMPGEFTEGTGWYTKLYNLDWVDARLLAERIRPLLTEKTDQLRIEESSNALMVTTDAEGHQRIKSVSEFFDDRKWYLPPEDRKADGR